MLASALAEIDPQLVAAITALHSCDHLLRTGAPPALQVMLEEAIQQKTGQPAPNLSAIVQSVIKQSALSTSHHVPAQPARLSIVDDGGEKLSIDDDGGSDNEMELDMLLKEDLMCVVCREMDVGVRNRLLECGDCHSLYHQDCHTPPVSVQDAESDCWTCANCTEAKRFHAAATAVVVSSSVKSTAASSASSSSSSSSSSESKRASNGGHHKSSSSKGSKSSSSASVAGNSTTSSSSKGSRGSGSGSLAAGHGGSSSLGASNATSTRNPATPNINIISADKRIQIMKKKAASKIHEKRKISR